MALIDLVNGAWDENRPPDPELIKDCVHCGFCLPTCPSYLVFEEEMDSPRGRIVLMRIGHDEAEEVSDEMVTHFDRCLGCMACVTACPSGVQYDKLIEQTRPQIERHADRPLARARVAAGDLRDVHPPGPPARARAGARVPAADGHQRRAGEARRSRSSRALLSLAPDVSASAAVRQLPEVTPGARRVARPRSR